jgi:hypothetical protein
MSILQKMQFAFQKIKKSTFRNKSFYDGTFEIYPDDIRIIKLKTGESLMAILVNDLWWNNYIEVLSPAKYYEFIDPTTYEVVSGRVNPITSMIPDLFKIRKSDIIYMYEVSYTLTTPYLDLVAQENRKIANEFLAMDEIKNKLEGILQDCDSPETVEELKYGESKIEISKSPTHDIKKTYLN